MLFNFANVLIFLIVGCLFVVLNLTVSRLLHTKLFSGEKYIPYECGEDPIGDTRIKFNTRFYVIALIFLIFDVEAVFLFPWAVVFRDFGLFAFWRCSFYRYPVSGACLRLGKRRSGVDPIHAVGSAVTSEGRKL